MRKKKRKWEEMGEDAYKPPQNDVCDCVDRNGLAGDHVGFILLGSTVVASHGKELFLKRESRGWGEFIRRI